MDFIHRPHFTFWDSSESFPMICSGNKCFKCWTGPFYKLNWQAAHPHINAYTTTPTTPFYLFWWVTSKDKISVLIFFPDEELIRWLTAVCHTALPELLTLQYICVIYTEHDLKKNQWSRYKCRKEFFWLMSQVGWAWCFIAHANTVFKKSLFFLLREEIINSISDNCWITCHILCRQGDAGLKA